MKDWGKIKAKHEAAEEALEDEVSVEEQAEVEEDEAKMPYEELEAKYAEAEQRAADSDDKFMRAAAEMDNLRRRLERDVSKAHRYGIEKFVENVLPVIDSLEKAEELAKEQEDKAMHEGLELTMKLFLDMLKKSDVEQLNPVGETFNPEMHEAMSMQEDGKTPSNSVIAVFQKGYKLNDRVVRPARVIVAK